MAPFLPLNDVLDGKPYTPKYIYTIAANRVVEFDGAVNKPPSRVCLTADNLQRPASPPGCGSPLTRAVYCSDGIGGCVCPKIPPVMHSKHTNHTKGALPAL